MKKKSFILYCDYLEHIQMLDDVEAGKLFKAILQYAVDGTGANLSGASGMAFSFIKKQIERDNADYEAKCEKLRENGAKGGRPPQKIIEKPKGITENQKVIEETKRLLQEPKAPLNDNDTVTANDTDKNIIYVCNLLNQAKAKAGSRGRLKAKGAEWHIEEILNAGVSMDAIIAAAEDAAKSGKDIDWYSFKAMLIGSEKGGIL